MESTTGWVPWRRRSVTRDCKSWCDGTTSAWIWVATMWKSNAVMYVSFVCNKIFFSISDVFTSQSEVDFGITLVPTKG
jgi:hypothetical protein